MRLRWTRAVATMLVATATLPLFTSAPRAAGQDANLLITGMVRQTEIRVAPETTGRLASVEVMLGQNVHLGDLLAVLDNPELTASLGEAKAAAESASAERDRVYSGVRKEKVAIASQGVRTAEANLLLAQQQFDRVAALAGKDFASKQNLDDSTGSLAKAKADLDVKRAQVAEASAGPTAEERVLADARVALAKATVADLLAQLDKMKLVAPADGTIGIRVAEPGEIVGPGRPVMTLEVTGQNWFAFTMREDDLRDIAVGKVVGLTTYNGGKIEARVTELRPLGEFATWRAARAVGDHDLNSFRVRLDPIGGLEGLEPGMTVWLPNPR